MKSIDALIEQIGRLTAIILVLLTLLIIYDALSRYLFHSGSIALQELAWHLFEGAEGHGYATEAGQAVRRWSYQEHGFNQLVSYIDHKNHRSQAVAKRLGAKSDGPRADHEPDAEVWTHLPEPM